MNEAVYIQINDDLVSVDSESEEKKTKKQLIAMCIVTAITFVTSAGVGLYFLIRNN